VTEYESFADLNTDQPSAGARKKPRRRPAARKKRSGGLGVALAWLMGLFTLGFLCWTVIIVVNPDSPVNIFAVAEEPTATLWMTPTITSTPPTLPPTWTASPQGQVGPTQTLMVLPTATPTSVQTLDIAVEAPGEPTATLSLFQYAVRGSITRQANDNGDGCAWMSIAGAVYDIDGKPKLAVGILVRGPNFEAFDYTGTAPRFGRSGYEIFLNFTPYVETWTIQLFDRNLMPLSTRVSVRTESDCRKNVTIVNFQQNH
jgi:hypothetical protein